MKGIFLDVIVPHDHEGVCCPWCIKCGGVEAEGFGKVCGTSSWELDFLAK